MNPSERNLHQDITYWAPRGQNEFGVQTFESPTKLGGRWEERTEMVRNGSGEEFAAQAVVFLSADVVQKGMIALGDFRGYPDPFHSGLVGAAKEVKAFRKIPDLRNVSSERRAYL